MIRSSNLDLTQPLERPLQNYQRVFDFIRRTSSLRFRRHSERHIERSGAPTLREIFPGISKASSYMYIYL